MCCPKQVTTSSSHWLHVVSSQSSLSVGSDLDLTDTPSPACPLRRSWDANQEAAGIEVRGSLVRKHCSFVVSSIEVLLLLLLPVHADSSPLSVRAGVDVQLLSVSQL